ncbi:MAG: hypothetical protein ACHQ6U_13090, partial [Thermodesulfobacteriota bacterium]
MGHTVRSLLFLILSISTVYQASAVELTTVKVASGFAEPLFLTSPPGDKSRLFVVEQNTANIKIIKN